MDGARCMPRHCHQLEPLTRHHAAVVHGSLFEGTAHTTRAHSPHPPPRPFQASGRVPAARIETLFKTLRGLVRGPPRPNGVFGGSELTVFPPTFFWINFQQLKGLGKTTAATTSGNLIGI